MGRTEFVQTVRGLFCALIVVFTVGGLCGCVQTGNSITLNDPPKHNFWAWERPEDFSWLRSRTDVGVAFLAQTIVLKNNGLDYRPRMHTLRIPAGTFVTAVTRIETGRGASAPTFSEDQRKAITDYVVKTVDAKGVKAIQIDFDAAESERTAYKALVEEIRKALPEATYLSITAIASWCSGDRWLAAMPVDDVVPMVFDMGSDSERIKRRLSQKHDWVEPLCQRSYGIAGYDPVTEGIKKDRRFYYFSNRSWRKSDLDDLLGDK